MSENVAEVAAAIEASGLNYVAVFPNNDAGAEIILEALKRLEVSGRVRLIPSMRFEYFLSLLKRATAIVGNSSAAVREAPVYGVPAVNIGSRQLNRFRSASVMDVPEDRAAIVAALKNLPPQFASSRYFGEGRSAELFMAALRDPHLWETSRQKQFRDVAILGAEGNPSKD